MAKTYEEGLLDYNHRASDVVLLDVTCLPSGDPDAIGRFLNHEQNPAVLVTATRAWADTATDCCRNGAIDCIAKPFQERDVVGKIASALKAMSCEAQGSKTESSCLATSIVGDAIRRLPSLDRISASMASVLITGESGTGKEALARAIHGISPRKAGPFVVVDCRQPAAEFWESGVFGFRQISRSTNQGEKPLLEIASGGSIFFKEVSKIPIGAQARFMKLFGQQESALGEKSLDVRFLAATETDLKDATKQGLLRKDLYYKLSVFEIVLPPLRDRPDDIFALTQHLIHKFNRKHGKAVSAEVRAEVVYLLKSYTWPDNILELERVVERAVVLAAGDELKLDDVVIDNFSPPIDIPKRDATNQQIMLDVARGIDLEKELADYEAQMISRALELTGGHQSKAAGLLGMNPTTLNSKIKKYRVKPFKRNQ